MQGHPTEAMIAMMVEAAADGPCAKSKRAAILYHPYHLTTFYLHTNSPPGDFRCKGNDLCKKVCGMMCLHAEERALADGLAQHGHLNGWQMAHIKVVDGVGVPSGPPSCLQCARKLCEAGVDLWLWHAEGWRHYFPNELVHKTLDTLKAGELHGEWTPF